jgi:uncharacterized protein (DUF1800 family)
MAQVFRTSDLSIRSLVRAILRSDEFWSPQARGALVRSPVEWTVAAHQATGQLAVLSRAHEYMDAMGQSLFAPPTVAGWGQNAYWLTTARTWGKAAMAIQLRDVAQLSRQLTETAPMSPRDAATRAFAQFGIVTPSASTRKVVEGYITQARAKGLGDRVPRDLVQLMLMTPDFQLA